MNNKRIISWMLAVFLVFACVPMGYQVHASRSISDMSFQELKAKFNNLLEKIDQVDIGKRHILFGAIKSDVKDGDVDQLIENFRVDAATENEGYLTAENKEKYIYSRGISEKDYEQSLQLFNLLKILTVSERLEVIEDIEKGNAPDLIDAGKDIANKVDKEFPDLEDVIKDVEPSFDLEMYALVLDVLKDQLNGQYIIKDDPDHAGYIMIDLPTTINGVNVEKTVDDAIKGMTFRGHTFTSFDEMTTKVMNEINKRFSPSQMSKLKAILADYDLYKQGAKVVEVKPQEGKSEDGKLQMTATLEGMDPTSSKHEPVFIPLGQNLANALHLDKDKQIMIKLPKLDLEEGTPVEVKITQAEVKDIESALAVEIKVPGLGEKEVTLTLPVPDGIKKPQAYHGVQKGDVMRYEYRKSEVDNGEITFTTNLSPVVIAEEVAAPTDLKVSTKTTSTVALTFKGAEGVTYEVFNGDNLIASTKDQNYTVTGLNASTTYTFKVRAVYPNGLESEFVTVEATTQSNSSSGSSGGGGGGGGGGASLGEKVKANQAATVKKLDVVIEILQNAFGKDMHVKIQKFYDTDKLTLAEGQKIIGDVFEIKKDKDGDFKKAVTITLPFEKSKVDLEKQDVSLCYYDEDKDEWVALGEVKVSEDQEKISGEVTHFTKFAVIAKDKEVVEEVEEIKVILPPDVVGHWAEKYVAKLVEKQAISAYEDGTFRPDNTITRAEFVTLLVKSFDLEVQQGKVFEDTKDHWAKDFIATAINYDIASGYSDEAFGPDDCITREQMAVMIAKVLNIESHGQEMIFTDQDQMSDWAKSAIQAASEEKIISGYEDQTFKPQKTATRAEAVTVIVKAMK